MIGVKGSAKSAPLLAINLLFLSLIWDLGLDEFRKKSERFLPAEIASLGWNDRWHAFLHYIHLSPDRHLLQGHCRLHFSL